MESKLILFSQNRTLGSENQPTFIFSNPPLQADSFYVRKVSIPNSVYNVNVYNNTLELLDGVTYVTATIPVGNYQTDELLTEIGTQLTAVGATGTYSATRDVNTSLVSITNSLGITFTLGWDQNDVTKQMAYDLGFYPATSVSDTGKPQPVATSGTTHTANNVYWISPVKTINIQSNLTSKGQPAYTTRGWENIIESVQTASSYGQMITVEYENPIVVPLATKNITDIRFKLLDENLKPIDLNGRDWVIELVLKVYRRNT